MEKDSRSSLIMLTCPSGLKRKQLTRVSVGSLALTIARQVLESISFLFSSLSVGARMHMGEEKLNLPVTCKAKSICNNKKV